MLLQIREFIRRERVVSMQQLVREFGMDEQALQPLLTLWKNKGVIKECEDKAGCQSSCLRCMKKPPAFYQYLG
ncbi:MULTISPECIES: FeoC-like transcriptional regulator [Legionella]|uniref:Transcriptional regulator HTH-type FeoC domain-containing protein n=1 Tax=Legionella septentrionalis TaxID=2498109 RepID=A0A3S0VBJ4_9GAMM|nr:MULTISPECIES: FeoC-like transcriptional regulator [Legionella]MCP0913923.1 FeoC-like transcriptional regulator [Legionella sp. 27cVA30]RUQ90413.1 hypothetical protein EKM59_02060 [Legionella septentrionalis]RUR00064.1 hypothetical protein ELY11_03425 [Legionella septentrionalis]RUR10760.1 hypothetical protein ELY14_04260 [Legionella septentrionalis]RUR16487.1 hypothetical protein ELY10_03065 [Legionella septentrionalis]